MRALRRWWYRYRAAAQSRRRSRRRPRWGGAALGRGRAAPAARASRAAARVPRWAVEAAAAAALLAAVLAAARADPAAPWLPALRGALRDDTLVEWARALAGAAPAPGAGGAAVPAGAPPDAGGAAALPTGLGELRRPLQGDVVSWFGFRQLGGRPQYHTGLDFAGHPGDRVWAVAAGTVTFAGRSPDGAGYAVVIQHDGSWSTAYLHLDAPAVRAGQAVRAGETLGRLGAFADPGSNLPAALHFELRDGGHPVDPAPYLGLVPAGGG
ncbi:MAG: M23 family metallopeptidase [Firmicutes bacterium]|nr:M23 family metallopeptidase [Bacillota bacterium]